MIDHTTKQKMDKMISKCIKLISWKTPSPQTYIDLGILTIQEMIKLANWKLGHKLYNHNLPKKIESLLQTDKLNDSLKKKHKYETRHKNLMNQPLLTTRNYHNSFLCETLKMYHQLPKELRDIKTIKTFTNKCKELLHKNSSSIFSRAVVNSIAL